MRFCIWMQGCHNGCRGCFAQDTWDPAGGVEIDETEIISSITRNANVLEGLTLLGGEPFEQAGPAARVAEAARKLGLSVVVFTGHIYEDMIAGDDADSRRLLAVTDLLIDGPYMEELRDLSAPWKGSSNQRYIFLTDRYDLEKIAACKNSWEVHISPDGVARINGMGNYDRIADTFRQFILRIKESKNGE